MIQSLTPRSIPPNDGAIAIREPQPPRKSYGLQPQNTSGVRKVKCAIVVDGKELIGVPLRAEMRTEAGAIRQILLEDHWLSYR